MLITEENNLEPYPRKKENAQIKVWLKKQLIKFYNKLVINRATIVISSPHIGAKALAKIFLWSKFKISIFPSDDISEDIIRTSKFPPRKNKRSPRSSPESDFCVYESLFVKYLPLCYSKTQDLGHAVIREFNLPIKPKSIFTANSYQFNELFKAYLVQSCNEPCSLHIAQHGGHYGMGEFNLTEKHEREISDFYWTWGWKDSYYSGATILPTGMIKPKLKARRQRSRHKRRVKLLLIGLAVPKHAYRFYSTPMGVGILNQYLFLRNVLKALSNEKFELHYRLSPNSRGWNQVAIADWIFNGRNFVITESDYTTDIRNSDLVLCINNGTNFLEVCHANVPCLWLLDQTQWSFRESAYNLICRLANARIVHTDPKSAIEFINSVDINDWWHSEAVQSVRDEFCSVFAAESNDFTRLFLERLR
jgi:putative transferase (TIGR04331 family)